MTPILEITGLCHAFGALIVMDDVNLALPRTGLHALIGPNGAGKTTLIGLVAGERPPDAGTIRMDGVDLTHLPAPARARAGLGRSFQISQLYPEWTPIENVTVALMAAEGHAFRFWRPILRDSQLRGRAQTLLAQAGLEAPLATPCHALSHGERRQLELAMALAGRARLLLLDEPMAGLGAAESRRMTETLATLKRTIPILLVEHDMDAVFALADQISVLVRGRVISTGTPDAIRSDPAVRDAYLGHGA